MTTITQARDDMLTLVASAIASLSYTPQARTRIATPIQVRYDGVDNGDPLISTQPWMKVSVQHASADQRSLGPAGSRTFERTGMLSVQIFTPVSDAQHLSLSETYSTVVRNAVEGVATPNGVWFRRVSVVDVGSEETTTEWYQTNVLAMFEYYEIR